MLDRTREPRPFAVIEYCGGEYGGCRGQEQIFCYLGNDILAMEFVRDSRWRSYGWRQLPALPNGVKRIGFRIGKW